MSVLCASTATRRYLHILYVHFVYRANICLEKISMLRFAEDIVLLDESEEDLGKVLNGVVTLLCEDLGLIIDISKTQVTERSRDNTLYILK